MAFSRRELLKMTGGALGASALVSRFSMMSALAQTTGPDYKALVCIYLHGGNDGINTVVPYEQGEYNYYAATRPTIALPRTGTGAILPLTPPITPLANSRAFALHPSMPELQTLWASKQLAILCNVGTLTEPLTPTTYRAKSATSPASLFDHSMQSNEWQGLGAGGWGQTIGVSACRTEYPAAPATAAQCVRRFHPVPGRNAALHHPDSGRDAGRQRL